MGERPLYAGSLPAAAALSRTLGIGVNDLLSGEIIPEEKVREKSERNIMKVADLAQLTYLGNLRTGMAGLLSLFVLLLIYCVVKIWK